MPRSTPTPGSRWRHHRNTDPQHDVTVLAVNYHWTQGPDQWVTFATRNGTPEVEGLSWFLADWREVDPEAEARAKIDTALAQFAHEVLR